MMKKLALLLALLLAASAGAQPITRIPASKIHITVLNKSLEDALVNDAIVGDPGCTNGQVPVWNTANSKWDCGAGGSQTPWTANVDGGGYTLTDVGAITGSALEWGVSGFDINAVGDNGVGWVFSWAESSPFYGAAGVAADNTTTIGYNYNRATGSSFNKYNPSFFYSMEGNWDATFPTDTYHEAHYWAWRAIGTVTVASGTGLAANDPILVREPANGLVVAIGIISADTGTPSTTTLKVDWVYGIDNANTPASGDTIEKATTMTVTSVVGDFTFGAAAGGVLVSSTASCTGLTAANAAAVLAFTANPTSGDTAWTFLQTRGLGTAVVSGKCAKQYGTAATAILGTPTVSQSTTASSAWTPSQEIWKPFTSVYGTHSMKATMNWFSGKVAHTTQQIPTLRIGATGPNLVDHWFGIASNWSDPGGLGIIGAIGDPTNQRNMAHHGKWWFYESTYDDANDYISVGAPAAVVGPRTQLLADASGTIPALNLTGCAAGEAIVATDAVGGVECGAAPAPGHGIQEEGGATLAQEPILNFVGGGVTATAGTGKTIVTIPGAGTQTKCDFAGNVDATDDAVLFRTNDNKAIKVTGFACRTQTLGPAVTIAHMALKQDINTIGDGDTTCTEYGDTMVYEDVSSDADGEIAAGVTLNWSVVNTPDPVTSVYVICYSYIDN